MKKIIYIGVMLIMFIGIFNGCGNKYNAIMYSSDVKELMREDFLKENRTYGAHYDINLVDTTSPETRTFIIKDQSRFDEIFTSFPSKVDFEKEMILIFTFTDVTGNRPYNLENIEMDDSTIKIKYKYRKSGDGPGASAPLQRFLVIKMDKLDITSAEFIDIM